MRVVVGSVAATVAVPCHDPYVSFSIVMTSSLYVHSPVMIVRSAIGSAQLHCGSAWFGRVTLVEDVVAAAADVVAVGVVVFVVVVFVVVVFADVAVAVVVLI